MEEIGSYPPTFRIESWKFWDLKKKILPPLRVPHRRSNAFAQRFRPKLEDQEARPSRGARV